MRTQAMGTLGICMEEENFWLKPSAPLRLIVVIAQCHGSRRTAVLLTMTKECVSKTDYYQKPPPVREGASVSIGTL